MQTWIALFRGINVGGHNILPMADLVAELQSLNLRSVRTYIQSGNAVFESSARSAGSIGKRVAKRIEETHGFRPQVLLLKDTELADVIAKNPYSDSKLDPKTVHFFFMDDLPIDPNIDDIEDAKAASESFTIMGRVFYLHAPDGIGRSKLAAKAERLLGVPTTARNRRTVRKLFDMTTE